MPAVNAPNTPPAARPNVVRRELVVTSVIAEGSTRGVTGGLEHHERLRQHQRAQRGRVEQPGVVLERHHDGERGPSGERDRQRRAPAALYAVEQRPDHGRDQGERRRGDREVEGDVGDALGLRRREEQRVRQRDGDRGVHRVGHHRGVGEGGEAGAVGPVRGRGAVERAHRALGELPAAHGRHPGHGDLARELDAPARPRLPSWRGPAGPAAGGVPAGPPRRRAPSEPGWARTARTDVVPRGPVSGVHGCAATRASGCGSRRRGDPGGAKRGCPRPRGHEGAAPGWADG